jgi:hypothetical protein
MPHRRKRSHPAIAQTQDAWVGEWAAIAVRIQNGCGFCGGDAYCAALASGLDFNQVSGFKDASFAGVLASFAG